MSPDDLNWFESNIESVQAIGRELVVVASNIGVLGQIEPIRARVSFFGVASAKREVTEYIGNPKGNPTFKAPYVVNDLPEIYLPGAEAFGLEGISTFEPIAWLDIEIKAQGGTVEVL